MARIVMMAALSLFAAACGGSDDAPTPAPTPVPSPSPAPAGTLTGIVTNESGARLSVLVQVTEGAGRGQFVNTNSAGEYTLGSVGPGTVTLRAASKGYRDQFVPVVVDGSTTVNFTLQRLPKGVLTGVVSDVVTGAGIPGATVLVLRDITTDVVDDWGRTTTTDSRGVYMFENMTLGNVNISATAPGYQERRTGGNISLVPALNLTLRAAPVPETFSGRIGWLEPSSCVYPDQTGRFAPSQYPCAGPQFTMRRSGAIDVTVTWEGAGESALLVHVIHENFGIVRELRAAAGSNRIMAFSQTAFWPGNWSIRLIDMDNARAAGTTSSSTRSVAFRLTLTRWD